ncbi:MAG: hypothetical protein M3R15_34945, partial [Acidobacteriota bacterium]|nr:hypothetical protein [Acidobacteriota bacterium]
MSKVFENETWDSVLHAIESKLNHLSFDTWIRPIRFEGYDEANQTVFLRVPNQVVKDWVSSN